ncbi:hypothetical protein COK_0122 [Mannheimia haemolytica serotype A2 str. BOVINE]|nr:hypothetical protein COK_0122 [Mannheimia haemolytica serotype A2 str. BOVINE]
MFSILTKTKNGVYYAKKQTACQIFSPFCELIILRNAKSHHLKNQ